MFVWGSSADETPIALAALYDVSNDSWQTSPLPDSGISALYAASTPGTLVATAAAGNSLEINLFDTAINAWSTVPLPVPANPLAYKVWLGDALLIWGGYIDMTPPDQCANVPDGYGCDPASFYEPILDGMLFRIDCASN